MKIYELFIDEEAEVFGIDCISLVEEPAIESDFISLKSQQKPVKLATQSEEQKIVMGPALIPNKMIYRQNEEGEYHVYFSKQTVRRAMELFFKNGYQRSSSLEHQHKLNGLTVVESWVVEGELDKSRHYGLDVPAGTWMVSMKVDNDSVWEEYVKTGVVKGFSIEGYFAERVSMSKEKEELESFADYPDSVKNNAKRGIELNEKQGNKCATQTGKTRAQQLAKGEAVSMDTIKRMHSYLSRAEEYYDESDTSACGTISYLLWGGKSAKSWAEKKLKEKDMLKKLEELCKESSIKSVIQANGTLK